MIISLFSVSFTKLSKSTLSTIAINCSLLGLIESANTVVVNAEVSSNVLFFIINPPKKFWYVKLYEHCSSRYYYILAA